MRKRFFPVSDNYPPKDTRLIIFRKQWKRSVEWTTLQCDFCTDLFERRTSAVKQARKGTTFNYCSASCAGRGTHLRRKQGLVAKLVNAQD